ncbi:MAG: class I SAM-dependent methyltransferase [Legionellaceae bacterium]|nr:class I SAM-dependent methyltransferase [Legionellaceae bacterium]
MSELDFKALMQSIVERKSKQSELSALNQLSLFRQAEWNAENYALNSTPQMQFALEALNKNDWFSNYISSARSPINVLDIGCGDGKLTNFLARKYPSIHITGIDKSLRMIELAQQRYPNINFVHMDAADSELPYRFNKKFDCILSFSTIHWIENQEQLFKNICSLTNSSPQICCMFYSRDDYLWNTIEITAKSEKWHGYFPNYTTPYYGETDELKQSFIDSHVSSSYDSVSQEYQSGGRTQLKNYLSGITPIYSSLQEALISENIDSNEIQRTINCFIDDVIQNLALKENSTFIEHENGSSTFNYTRVIFHGTLMPEIDPQNIKRMSISSL